jgi:hypothetical protein
MSMPMATGVRRRPGPIATLAGACAAVVVTVALRLLPFGSVTVATRRLSLRARRTASSGEALRMLQAVDSGARLVPFRVACLERSLSVVLLLALRRANVTWCMGVRTPPLASHAWIASPNGEPIGEPVTTATYRPLLVISSVTTTNRSNT